MPGHVDAARVFGLSFACAALVVLLGCDAGSKKLGVTSLTVATQEANQDATKEDAVLNFSTLEVFELNLAATGSGFPEGSSTCETQFFKQGSNQPAMEKTRCNLERTGQEIKVYQRLISPEEAGDCELRISHDGKRILTRKAKVVKKAA